VKVLSVPISALQHFAFCPRQFALIHIEQAWQENFHTATGNVLHERVNSKQHEQRGLMRSERTVRLQSEKLGIHGTLDLLEISEQPDATLIYFPVEYKRGKRKIFDWDRIQLCAQAMCLEEMCSTAVSQGALWYWQERLRETVLFDAARREATENCIANARMLLENQTTPPPTKDQRRCRACSLIDFCQPRAMQNDKSQEYSYSIFNVANNE
jgi:CRISPR-associated exonuclease Cas4